MPADLVVHSFASHDDLGRAAGQRAADLITDAINHRGAARVILAAAPSQLPVLSALRSAELDFSKITFFHMDDYIGLASDAPQGFGNWLEANFISQLPTATVFHRIDTMLEPEVAAASYAETMGDEPFDLTLCGLGINAHLAFNDPGAAFNDPLKARYIELAIPSRQQQVDEGHFPDLASVPTHAVTVTIPRLLNTKHIICSVLGAEKLTAVTEVLDSEPTEDIPGTALKLHEDVHVFLDQPATPIKYR